MGSMFNLKFIGLAGLRIEVLGYRSYPDSRVHDWNDGQRNSGDWEIRAASASSETASHCKEVIVVNKLATTFGLEIFHHEKILGTPGFLFTTLLSSLGGVVRANCSQINLHQSLLLAGVTSLYSILLLGCMRKGMIEAMPRCAQN
jgi:hypothetical protein